MKPAPPPANEIERLAALSDAAILDTPAETAFDDLTQLAAAICGTPIALVSLVDRDRQWFKSKVGLDASETPRDLAFCAHAILEHGVFHVPDAFEDDRFADNPLVTGPPNVRFYAGAPLETEDGYNVGTLCVIDHDPRELDEHQREALQALARQVSAQIDLRRVNRRLARLNDELVVRAREAEAARVQLDELLVQARAAERAKDEFISTVSHELRTPLTSIRGALGLMEGGVLGRIPDDAMEVVHIARANTDRLVRLINDILDLEKIEAGKLQLDPRLIDVERVVASVLESMAPIAGDANVTLRKVIEGRFDLVVDEDRIAQVLMNLVSNAIKYSPAAGTVDVRVEGMSNGKVRFSVRDRGPGIAEADRNRLFGRFEQLDSSDRRRTGGTGLGLSIAKAIVEQHGGIIGVTSEVGQGSTFWFELASTSPIESSPTSRRPAVLVVEDDGDLARLLIRDLETQGYYAFQAASIAAAQQVLATVRVSAILLDIRLPDGNGLELLEQLRQDPRTQTIPVIVISGHANDDGYASPLLVDWFTKPFDMARLASSLRWTVRKKKRARVLVVEDDPMFRQLLVKQLAAHDAEVVQAASGEEALHLARASRPDLIILDVGLPKRGGAEVVAALRSDGYDNIPLIVYTGRDIAPQEREALRLGITHFLTKSRATEAELMRKVRDLLSGLSTDAGELVTT